MRRRLRRQRGMSALQSVLLAGTAFFITAGVREAWKAAKTPFAAKTELAVSGQELTGDGGYGKDPTGGDAGDKPAEDDDTTAAKPSPAQEAADATWKANAANAAKNFADQPEIEEELAKAAAANPPLTVTDLKRVVAVESQANKGATNGSHYGLFQIGDKAAIDAGTTLDKVDDADEWKKNIEAGAAYLNKYRGQLEKNDIPITPIALYMLFQQGPSGGLDLLKAVKDGTATGPATARQLEQLPKAYKAAMKKDHGNVTQQDYYDFFVAVFQDVAEVVK